MHQLNVTFGDSTDDKKHQRYFPFELEFENGVEKELKINAWAKQNEVV